MSIGRKQLDRIFTALGNQHRREIVYHLSLQPASITELAKKQKLSLPAMNKHIAILEDAKLIQRKKVGRVNFLALDRTALRALHDWLSQYNPYWGSNEATLENYIKRITGE